MRLGTVIDLLQWLIYAVYHANGGKPKKPDPWPRPGVIRGGGSGTVSADGRAWLLEQRERNRQAREAAGADQPAVIAPAAFKDLTQRIRALRGGVPTEDEG